MIRPLHILMAFVLSTSVLVAQPNLGEVTIPTPSKSIGYRIASAEGVGPGESGVGVTWDFTALVTSPDTTSRRFIRPQEMSLELQERYPTATYAVVADTVTNVYEKQDTTVRWLGRETPASQAMAGVADPYDIRPIEIVFNQPHADAFRGTFTPAGAPGSFERTGSLNFVYDGFGTLLLPNSQRFENVARILHNESSVDSLQAGPNLIELRMNDNRAIYRSSTSDTVYMMIISQSFTRIVNGLPEGETVRNERVLYLNGESSTSVNEEILQSSSVFPNPITGSAVTIKGTDFEAATVEIVGLQGQTIPAPSFTSIGNSSTRVQLPSLTPGRYIIQVRSNCATGPCRRVDASVVIVR